MRRSLPIPNYLALYTWHYNLWNLGTTSREGSLATIQSRCGRTEFKAGGAIARIYTHEDAELFQEV